MNPTKIGNKNPVKKNKKELIVLIVEPTVEKDNYWGKLEINYLIHVDEWAEEECEVLLHEEAQDLIPKEFRLQPRSHSCEAKKSEPSITYLVHLKT